MISSQCSSYIPHFRTSAIFRSILEEQLLADRGRPSTGSCSSPVDGGGDSLPRRLPRRHSSMLSLRGGGGTDADSNVRTLLISPKGRRSAVSYCVAQAANSAAAVEAKALNFVRGSRKPPPTRSLSLICLRGGNGGASSAAWSPLTAPQLQLSPLSLGCTLGHNLRGSSLESLDGSRRCGVMEQVR